ncbi:hypothetical protein QF037_000179 [Streptomyces canus]|uniref:hypothetical protein n=1 Tax=Streptomyces canus TaxID=58343 RepID=UPI0027813636|nr:hypothetical protein [Streptomyces canus]MDQ0595834.1 hypothetical protein [Streptomyces canus]
MSSLLTRDLVTYPEPSPSPAHLLYGGAARQAVVLLVHVLVRPRTSWRVGPERLAAKLTVYARLHGYIPAPPPGTRRTWRQRYPLFPRLLDGTGPTGIDNRIHALRAAARDLIPAASTHQVPILAAPLTDLLRDGPSAPVWHPATAPGQQVSWTH